MKRDFLTTAFIRIRGRMSRTGDTDDYDSLQEAFCRLWARCGDIAGLREAESLLSTTARNIRIDGYRRRTRLSTVDVEAAADIPDADPDSRFDIYRRVEEIVRRILSPRDRDILHLRDRDGMEFAEIAAIYGISEANVRMILSRARKAVREAYAKQLSQYE